MAAISVAHLEGTTYRVTISERNGQTTHEVVVTSETLGRYAPAGTAPERLVHASFEFLLARESKESILHRFDLAVIERYFPDYRRDIRRALGL
jgi:hypothetical protein